MEAMEATSNMVTQVGDLISCFIYSTFSSCVGQNGKQIENETKFKHWDMCISYNHGIFCCSL